MDEVIEKVPLLSAVVDPKREDPLYSFTVLPASAIPVIVGLDLLVEGDFIVFPAPCIHRGLPNTKKRKTIISYNFSIDGSPIEGRNSLDLDKIKKLNPNIWHSQN